MPDRPWSDTDRELLAGLVRALPPPPRLGEIGGLGPSPEEFADRVLDALTERGWRDLSRVSEYLIDGKLYDPRDVQILTPTEADDE